MSEIPRIDFGRIRPRQRGRRCERGGFGGRPARRSTFSGGAFLRESRLVVGVSRFDGPSAARSPLSMVSPDSGGTADGDFFPSFLRDCAGGVSEVGETMLLTTGAWTLDATAVPVVAPAPGSGVDWVASSCRMLFPRSDEASPAASSSQLESDSQFEVSDSENRSPESFGGGAIPQTVIELMKQPNHFPN
jgi:hypothetical protein